jgi:hypothetical protein
MVRKRRFGSARWTNDKTVIRLAPAEAEVERIYFLEMHPERMDYTYLSFLEDRDGTRNWDRH